MGRTRLTVTEDCLGMYSCNSVFGRPVLNINEEDAQSDVEESDIEGLL